MCLGIKKPAGNTDRIAKGFAEAWVHFYPSKPYLPVSIDGPNSRAVTDRSIQWEDLFRRTTMRRNNIV